MRKQIRNQKFLEMHDWENCTQMKIEKFFMIENMSSTDMNKFLSPGENGKHDFFDRKTFLEKTIVECKF